MHAIMIILIIIELLVNNLKLISAHERSARCAISCCFTARCTRARSWCERWPEVTSYRARQRRHAITWYARRSTTCGASSSPCWCTISASLAPSGGRCSLSAGTSLPLAR